MLRLREVTLPKVTLASEWQSWDSDSRDVRLQTVNCQHELCSLDEPILRVGKSSLQSDFYRAWWGWIM